MADFAQRRGSEPSAGDVELIATAANQHLSTADEHALVFCGLLFLLFFASIGVSNLRSKRKQRAIASDPWHVTETYPPSKTPGPRVVGRGMHRPSGQAFLRVEVPIHGASAPVPPPGPLLSHQSNQIETSQDDLSQSPTESGNGPESPREGCEGQGTTPLEGGTEAQAGPARDIEIRVLGPLEASGWITEPSRKIVIELAAYMALHKTRPVQTDELRAALWPSDNKPEANSKTLRSYFSLLREAAGEDALPHAARGVGYRAGRALTSDWERFQGLVATAGDLDERQAVETLEVALELVRGSPFQGVEPGTFLWASTQLLISEMEVTIAGVARRVVDARISWGDYALASAAATRGLVGVPFDFGLWSGTLRAARGLGPDALTRARRDAIAVLGDDASRVDGWRD